MKKQRLGRSEIIVAPLALGGNVFGWTADRQTSFRLLDKFVDAGFNLVDTADTYSNWVPGHVGGESEILIGEWIAARGRRSDVVIATKVGMEVGPGAKGLSREYILRAVEASLQRLGTDYIDLYQSHEDDPSIPMEETLGAFQTLIEQGKVRVIGASNFSAERLDLALSISGRNGLPRYEVLQPWYNLYDRDKFEGSLANLCRANDLAVLSYFSLAAGFLTGAYRTEADLAGKARAGRVGAMLATERGHQILAAMDDVAKGSGASHSQIAIAWLRTRGVTAPLASATSEVQLDELLGSADVHLDPGQLALLDRASAVSTE